MKRIKLKGDTPSLILTPLLDMFTIILIFLLVSLDADMAEFKRGLADLPKSEARGLFKPAVNVEITREAIRVDPVPGVNDRDENDRPIPWMIVVPLNDGEADERFVDGEEAPDLVALFEAHYAERKLRYEKRLQEAGDKPIPPDEEPILLILADKTISYKTLYLVLKSAGKAGFGKYRLATVQGGK